MALRNRNFVPPPAARSEPSTARTIPFDHSFQFSLTGVAQTAHRKTVTVSVESSFVAVSIGYGVVPEITPIQFGPPTFFAGEGRSSLRNIRFDDLLDTLGDLAPSPDVPGDTPPVEAALLNGIKLNPEFAGLALQDDGNASLDNVSLSRLFQVASAPASQVQFLYTLNDDASGREFQSAPILSIAGLGAADGKRPFRYFAQPITFSPLATIRMDVTELSDVRGELHVVLHGYKVIGDSAPQAGRASVRGRRR
jgi:hypothetical protein